MGPWDLSSIDPLALASGLRGHFPVGLTAVGPSGQWAFWFRRWPRGLWALALGCMALGKVPQLAAFVEALVERWACCSSSDPGISCVCGQGPKGKRHEPEAKDKAHTQKRQGPTAEDRIAKGEEPTSRGERPKATCHAIIAEGHGPRQRAMGQGAQGPRPSLSARSPGPKPTPKAPSTKARVPRGPEPRKPTPTPRPLRKGHKASNQA